ncbi:MAG: ABC transporter substrate-binding protein [Candidatus Bathyarchaeota archaeon]|nr:ABC transporter substrate-binding protein [Candidatus Bathyarchaeota archaeon]
MNLKRTVSKLAIVSILLMTFIVFMGAAQPYVSTKSAYTDEHWFDIIIDAASYQIALLEHEIDMGGVGLPEYMDPLDQAGFTLTSTQRLGYTFFMTNNRRWPCGGYGYDDPIYGPSGDGTPTEAWANEAMHFRKGLNRLIDMDYIVGELYAPLMSECEYYLPPGAAYWINPAAPGPEYNPGTTNDMFPLVTGSAYLNEGGFLPGDDDNTYADADETADYYSAKLRVDPRTGNTLDEVEYYAIGPVESPIGYEAARVITAACHTAGVPIQLVAGTWLGMVTRLVNGIWNDYQIMTGVGIVWGSPAPDILYDFTYSQNLPLWNFVAQNSSAADAAGIAMMSTLNLAACRQAAFDIQTYLSDYEPYKPYLLWEDYFAETGPYEDEPGLIGIVNFVGRNPHSSSNPWGKMLTRAGRDHPTSPGLEINKWGLGAFLDTLNPLTADTVPDWQVLTGLFEGHYSRNPYTLEYMWAGAEDMPTIEEWIAPGGSDIYGGYPGCDATYDATFNGTHYDGIPIADVTGDNLVGDDVLGMVTTWTLREGQYWHDSDAGADGIYGTGDDGAKHPTTTADVEFGFNLLRYQENKRYMTQWQYVYAVEPIDTYTFKLYEERRFLFAFEGHDVGLLAPKHIWESYIFSNPSAPSPVHDDYLTLTRPDGTTGAADCWNYMSQNSTGYANHHDFWDRWQDIYMTDPNNPGYDLTYLIGNGPFVYHHGGWIPGSSARFESNPVYFAGHICPADIDFNQRCEPATEDVNKLLSSIGTYGAPNYLVECDTAYPAQIVELSEISQFLDHSGNYWGPDPVPSGFVRCPSSTVE